MINELVELAERIRSEKPSELSHDALKKEWVGIDCVITSEGKFLNFLCFDKIETLAEALPAKKGKARLLLDKCEEVLGVEGKAELLKDPSGDLKSSTEKKHQLFLAKLSKFENIPEIEPVRKFYGNSPEGLKAARERFFKDVPEKKRVENIAFRIQGTAKRIHEEGAVREALISFYEDTAMQDASEQLCSICGSNKYPVKDIPHGMIKRVPDGQSSGCALVSYNSAAFESYGQKGNYNSAICTHCGKAYVEGLNWLMTNGNELPAEGKKKPGFRYSNRKKISSDTAFVFWTRASVSTDILDLLETPTEDAIRKLLDAPHSGTMRGGIDNDRFFGITLSGAAARIAVRDWMEESIPQVNASLKRWFTDIAIFRCKTGDEEARVLHPGIGALVYASMRQSDSSDDVAGRIGALLWSAAIKQTVLPLRVLSVVIGRIRAEQGKITAERASLIKLFLNRNQVSSGGNPFMEKLDESNSNTPYLCGRLFAVLERLQYHAQGDVNAGIGERFFTSASSTPATAFGRLMKLSKQHLSKLKGEKPGLAVNIDKEIQSICAAIVSFPTTFRLEEQGAFALGYYHQRNSRNEKNIIQEGEK